jgi:lysophospholipase L1-like esterase
VLLFGLLEGGLSLVFLIKDRYTGSDSGLGDQRIHADTYADSSWVRDYYVEHHAANAQWKPYVYWRREPFRGEYINVDNDGIRLTTAAKPRPPASGTPVKIFMFGGSTLWGTGARDTYTIPSILQKELQDRGAACEVINFAEGGYVSTQEVITLLLQLQRGHVPDVVVFYDGVNDTYSAYQQNVAGWPQNEFNRVREFNLSNPEKTRQRRQMVVQDVASGLATVRLLKGLLRRSGVRSQSVAAPQPSTSPAWESESLPRDVLTTYLGNIELVKALSEHYRFKYLFYWQPTIFQKTNLTDYERGQRDEVRGFEPFFQKTYDVVRQSGIAEKKEHSFHDLSLIFADMREPVYVDWHHLGESGNAIIARRMAKDVQAILSAGKGR